MTHGPAWSKPSRQFRLRRGNSARSKTSLESQTPHVKLFPQAVQRRRASIGMRTVMYFTSRRLVLFCCILSSFGSFEQWTSVRKMHLEMKSAVRGPYASCITWQRGSPHSRIPTCVAQVPLWDAVERPLDHVIEIEAAEQSESEALLRAAIAHWNALGKCSPDGLRQGFFQRDGKLEKRESGWHLVVERKAQDILLDRLPQGWGSVW